MVVADEGGNVRYLVTKPFAGSAGKARRAKQHAWIESCDSRDAALAWAGDRHFEERHALRTRLKTLYASRPPRERDENPSREGPRQSARRSSDAARSLDT